jgi:hypothetical protein
MGVVVEDGVKVLEVTKQVVVEVELVASVNLLNKQAIPVVLFEVVVVALEEQAV